MYLNGFRYSTLLVVIIILLPYFSIKLLCDKFCFNIKTLVSGSLLRFFLFAIYSPKKWSTNSIPTTYFVNLKLFLKETTLLRILRNHIEESVSKGLTKQLHSGHSPSSRGIVSSVSKLTRAYLPAGRGAINSKRSVCLYSTTSVLRAPITTRPSFQEPNKKPKCFICKIFNYLIKPSI